MKAIKNMAGLIGLLFFGACQFNANTEDDADKQTAAADTLTYEYEEYIKYSENLIKTSETTDTTYFAVSYPRFQDSLVNRFVLATLLGNDTASVAGTAQTFIREFDDFQQSDPFPRVWTSESHAKVYRISPSYLALALSVSTYTGGAHGNYATVFAHYDLTEHKSLTLDDIVTKPFQNELTAVGERYFRKQEKLGVDQTLEDQYFFDQGQFTLPQNFALERDSMVFRYSIYEIKPYAAGETELRIPYADVDRLLTDRAKRIIAELPR
ncbi:DUF3298 domain-containing protein [Parapedobacter sp. DT-150]|uniref:DUF3298 and DUF4163 domain-containing protein n=1 Tax=Parapedobacter sp. DT-150 TaxID=3396162 RepID=UPI003F1D78F7